MHHYAVNFKRIKMLLIEFDVNVSNAIAIADLVDASSFIPELKNSHGIEKKKTER